MDDLLLAFFMVLAFADGLWLGWWMWRKPQLDSPRLLTFTNETLERFAAIVAAHEREKPVTVPANGLRQQEPSRSTPTGSQSNEIVPVGYVDAMFRFQTCQEHYVSPSDRFKPVYTAKQIEAAVLAEREINGGGSSYQRSNNL